MTRPELDCDAAVIGAGMAGLVAAATLARAGCRVILLEQHDRPGGYMSGFHRQGLPFDAAVHFLNGCGPGGVLEQIFNELGCADLQFACPDPMTTMVFPGRTIEVPQSLDEFRRLLRFEFPGSADGIDGFFGAAREVYEVATDRFNRIVSGGQTGGQVASEVMKRYQLATVRDFLTDLVTDPEAAAVLNGQLCYSGLPASRISAIWYLIQLATHHLGGSYYPLGGTQVVADRLARAITEANGKILYNTAVCSIPVAGGRVTGVKTTDGSLITAGAVVSAASAHATLCEWLAPEVVPPRVRRLAETWEPAISAVLIYLILDGDLDGVNGSNYLIHQNPDFEQLGAELAAGRMPADASVFLSVPTIKDPNLAPPGTHCISAITLAPYTISTDWRVEKERVTDKLLSLAAAVIPGLKSRCRHRETASPVTLERYTGNWQGSCYGLAATPRQVFVTRPPNRPGIDGLFLAGHWTFPGLGIQAVAQSGFMTARLVLDHLDGAQQRGV